MGQISHDENMVLDPFLYFYRNLWFKKAHVLGGQLITGLGYYLETNHVVHISSRWAGALEWELLVV